MDFDNYIGCLVRLDAMCRESPPLSTVFIWVTRTDSFNIRSDSGAFKTLDRDNNGTIKVNVQEVRMDQWTQPGPSSVGLCLHPSVLVFTVASVDHVLLSADGASLSCLDLSTQSLLFKSPTTPSVTQNPPVCMQLHVRGDSRFRHILSKVSLRENHSCRKRSTSLALQALKSWTWRVEAPVPLLSRSSFTLHRCILRKLWEPPLWE